MDEEEAGRIIEGVFIEFLKDTKQKANAKEKKSNNKSINNSRKMLIKQQPRLVRRSKRKSDRNQGITESKGKYNQETQSKDKSPLRKMPKRKDEEMSKSKLG